MKLSKKKIMENFQNELILFQNIPKKNYVQKKDNNDQNIQYSKIDPSFLDLQKIKVTKNIYKINKLYNTLVLIERSSSVEVAKKYLNGFLEERGINSLKQFINKQLS
ncbi:MAG: hypothetical protein L3J23_03435 [Flavobacteriaceae bacterium]|nr:hypothetical protein [Flavobacteriaceae bacterium]